MVPGGSGVGSSRDSGLVIYPKGLRSCCWGLQTPWLCLGDHVVSDMQLDFYAIFQPYILFSAFIWKGQVVGGSYKEVFQGLFMVLCSGVISASAWGFCMWYWGFEPGLV